MQSSKTRREIQPDPVFGQETNDYGDIGDPGQPAAPAQAQPGPSEQQLQAMAQWAKSVSVRAPIRARRQPFTRAMMQPSVMGEPALSAGERTYLNSLVKTCSFTICLSARLPRRIGSPKDKVGREYVFTVPVTSDTHYEVHLFPGDPITKCHILVAWNKSDPYPDLVAYGIGVRKHGDAWNWELGCRMALRSALKWFKARSDGEEVKHKIMDAYLAEYPVTGRPY